MNFIDLTVMNKFTEEMNKGFQEIVAEELELPEHASKADRVLQCGDCNSIEIHNPKFFSLPGQTCKKGCGFGFSSEDLVPLPIKCRNCGNQKGFDFPDDSGVEAAELANHEMYASAKASMVKEIDIQNDNDNTEILSELESEIAEATQLAENSPKVKGGVVQQVFTIEPREGFESSGFVENDAFHKGNIHETCYAHLVNPGNTPHMQPKLNINDLVDIKKSVSKGMINLWGIKTYGNRKTYKDCIAEIGFSPESGHRGSRKLSDQKIDRLLDNITFAQRKRMRLIEELEVETESWIQEKWKALKLYEEIDEQQEIIDRNKAIIKTGNASCGYQSPMYDVKINTYDPVDLVKLQMELDIPWNEEPIDTYKLFKTQKNKARTKKAAKTRAANKLKRAESQ